MLIQGKGQFIAGSWHQGIGNILESISPSNGQIFWKGYEATPEQVDIAIQNATSAHIEWRTKTYEQRLDLVERFGEIVKERIDEFANLISTETGKPLWEAKTEASAIAGKISPSKEAYQKRCSELSFEQSGGAIVRTRFQPHGAIAVLAPFNFPAHMPNGHMIPAVLAGNSVILKPSPLTPASGEFLIKCWEDVGVPQGLVSLVQGGAKLASYLINHAGINGVFFTGSFDVGSQIISNLCISGKMLAMEMGGDTPILLHDGEDVESVVFNIVQSSFITSGQRCSTSRRLIVLDNAFCEEVISKLVSVVEKLRVNAPQTEPEPYMGPLITDKAAQKILAYQTELKSEGGRPILESKHVNSTYSLITPGIIEVKPNSRSKSCEVMGPLLKLIKVKSLEDGINECNNTSYGLAAGLFSTDKAIFEKFYYGVRAGNINWNQATTGNSAWGSFGGIGQSGNHRPSGFLATDYCTYAVGSFERDVPVKPQSLPPGITL